MRSACCPGFHPAGSTTSVWTPPGALGPRRTVCTILGEFPARARPGSANIRARATVPLTITY